MSDEHTSNGSDEPFTHSPYGRSAETPNPYGAPQSPDASAAYSSPSHDQAPYGQDPYGQAPYGQAPYGAAPYSQNAYGYPMAAQAEHPQGTTVLVLGLVGLLLCQLVAPFAWVIGGKARREAKANPGRYSNEGLITAGWAMGIVGTVIMVLAILAFIAVVAFSVVAFDQVDQNYYNSAPVLSSL